MVMIEPVSPDAPAASTIVRAYMLDVASRWFGRPATTREVDQALLDEPCDDLDGDAGVLFLATEDDQPIGCVGVRFTAGVAELTKVFTLPAHRGRGVGSRLLRAAEEACRERGISTVRLDTRADLGEACALYGRLGFESVDAFNDEPYSDRWYSKALDRGAHQSMTG